MIETRKREHSRKPDEQYALIESCSPGAYLEMFARHARPGWTVWGDESSDEVTPRGTVHKGYAGGPILPPLLPNEHVDIARAGILGDQLQNSRNQDSGNCIVGFFGVALKKVAASAFC
jgi:hypothetical protein